MKPVNRKSGWAKLSKNDYRSGVKEGGGRKECSQRDKRGEYKIEKEGRETVISEMACGLRETYRQGLLLPHGGDRHSNPP
jgi:hypothetical protein